ncbi:hypothetical protein CYFUS_007403 [Cystobacter fuscus]|uniref:NACHT domain-containing protein n=1 Tax=Cystobacter fuscus TaxID=43 RepID=A0A250JEJ6_9BACT|nr:histidine kinase [Cystobacter fuscus]ATB41927.1 hypothetical protein CYFUS_007403 [Cystobacter fuscus]
MSLRVEEQLLALTAGTAFQLVWEGLKGLSRRIADHDRVRRGMHAYARNFLERYGNIKVLNMDQPVPLRDIYVAAQAIPPRAMKSFCSVEELHKLFLLRGKRLSWPKAHPGSRTDCLEHSNKSRFLNVLGCPGAGKSTFLRRLGLEALLPRRTWSAPLLESLGRGPDLGAIELSRYEHDCLPVLIELRRFRTDAIDLTPLIQNELAICGLPESGELVRTLLEEGRLLLLLDGVDEVPDCQLDKAISHMSDFVDRYSGNRFVISCRTAFYKGYFSRFEDVLLSDFDDQQVASFVQNWFRSDTDRQYRLSEEFLKLLGEPAHASARELAHTPLLLTFLCLTYDDRQRLPANRSELYRQALEILMERWAASKRVHHEPIYRELHARMEVQMLAEIAAPAFHDNRYFFTRRELTESITHFLREELNAPKHLNGDQVLQAIEVQQGLIVQRAQDAWSFSHLTLQEYLTAIWHEDPQRLAELVRTRLFDARWQEVFILLAGAVRKADDLLLRMQQSAEQHLGNAVRLVRWASSKHVPLDDAEQTAARRAFAMALAFDISQAIDLDRILAEEFDPYRKCDFSVSLIINRIEARGLGFDFNLARDLVRELGSSHDIAYDFNLDCSYIWAQAKGRARDFFVRHARCLINAFAELASSRVLSGKWDEVEPRVQVLRHQLSWNASFQDVLKTWRQLLGLFVRTLQLSPEPRELVEGRARLEKYLSACLLIVHCKDAAMRVSRSVWEEICLRMLNPPA